MSLLKLKPIKVIFEEIELVAEHPEWKWRLPSKFSLDKKVQFNKVARDRCYNWLVEELKKAGKPQEEDKVPSMVYGADQISRALATTMQMQLIPDDAQIDKYISRFYWDFDNEVAKEQIDIILTPTSNTPLASEIYEQADPDVIREVFTFFYNTAYKLRTPEISASDSGQSENSSSKTTQEPNT